jgi:hypothetical protein
MTDRYDALAPRRRLLVQLPALALWPALQGSALAGTPAEGTHWLVTPAEVAAERAAVAAAPPMVAGAPGAERVLPRIDVLAPAIDRAISSPFPVQLRFVPSEGAQIVRDSFRALYGVLKLDITRRLVEHARFDADGLALAQAPVPSGHHRLFLSVADSAGHSASRRLDFIVD